MTSLRLTLACGPYDRTLALRDGTIRPEGIELNYVTLQPAEIFWRMLQHQAPSTMRDIPLSEGQPV